MRKSLSLLLIPALALGACAHRQAKSAADEFDVVRNAPLVVPPDFTLTPPPAGTQLFWWPCETRWISDNQMWNIMPTNLADQSAYRRLEHLCGDAWSFFEILCNPYLKDSSRSKITTGGYPWYALITIGSHPVSPLITALKRAAGRH